MASESPHDEADELPLAVYRMTHRGRVVRIGIALAFTLVGLLAPAPYVGYAFTVPLFAPALVLLLAVARSLRAGQRWPIWAMSIPSAIGLALGLLSWWVVILPHDGWPMPLKLALATTCSGLVAWLFSELTLQRS